MSLFRKRCKTKNKFGEERDGPDLKSIVAVDILVMCQNLNATGGMYEICALYQAIPAAV